MALTPLSILGSIVFLLLLLQTDSAITYPKVTVKTGELRGISDDTVVTDGVVTLRKITKFLGVPYAAAPVGDLRFKAPKAMPAWNGVKKTNEFGDMCIQDLNAIAFTQAYQNIYYKHRRTSEDCLNLNVFSPVEPGVSQPPLPVMVWLHGGAFKWGTGMNSDGTQLALHGNVVVVTFNYRLNVFGFMSINGSSTNNGLRDQIMALQWVKDNIAVFGGDPSKVTVFGNSAGSVSAAMLAASPLARGLFKRVILQSGTSKYKHLLTTEEGYTASNIMATKAGCNKTTNEEVLTCLRSLSSDDLLKAWSDSQYTRNPTVPQYGDDLIPIEPSLLFKTGQVGDIDVLIGGNRHDGVGFVPSSVLTNPSTMDQTKFETELAKTLTQFYPLNSDKVIAALSYTYGSTSSYAISFLEAHTDRMLHDMEETADYLVDASKNVYFYLFTFTPTKRSLPWPSWIYGGHGDEIQFVFGDQVYPNGGTFATAAEKRLSRQMMTAWTKFASSGNPNPIDVTIQPPLVWSKYTKDRRQYVEFNINMAANRALEDYPGKAISFWRELAPKVATADECVDGTPDVESDQLVNTNNGYLRGVMKSDAGKTWEEYLGIPYAEEPARWRVSRSHRGWSGVRDAKQYGAQCYEFSNSPLPDWLKISTPEFSEDCLFLNVFVPKGVNYVRYLGLPVMIWLHGKTYNTTMGGFFPGHGLALFGSVIVVTVNFRMGALGFLPAGAANYGLYDQHLAIKWVYENIKNFGGDPNKITLIGQSAGAVTATLQALAPSNKGMIKNVIAQSGSPLSPWGMNRYYHYNEVKKLAGYFDCSSKDMGLMMNCLRGKPAMEIAMAPIVVSRTSGYWGPIVDGTFIPKDPMEMIKDGALKDINFIIGSNNHDGFEFASHFSTAELKNVSTMTSALSDILGALFVNENMIMSAVDYTWLGDYDTYSDDGKVMKLTDILTDMMYSAPAQKQADVQTVANGKVYAYTFKHRAGLQTSLPAWVQGNHLDEGYFVMGGPQYFKAYTHTLDDERLSNSMMLYWTNFAKNSDPNVGYQVSVTWPEFTTHDKRYIQLSSPVRTVPTERPESMQFWNDLVPALEGTVHNTCTADLTQENTTPDPTNNTLHNNGNTGNSIGEEEKCITTIGNLRLSADEAHRLLWVLGYLFGFTLIFCCILIAFIVYQHCKFNKLKISGRRGQDNSVTSSAM